MVSKPLLVISPKNKQEAVEAVMGGADIIDIKNPREGALGANFPWVIREVRSVVPHSKKLSASIGDAPDLPGTCSLASLGAAISGADIIKVGLFGTQSVGKAVFLMKNVVRTVKDLNQGKQVVAAGYADARRIGAIEPLQIPSIAAKANADFAMLDTAIKDGRGLFYHMTTSQLRDFVAISHNLKLKCALAGLIEKQDIAKLCDLKVDVIGMRSAVCVGGRVKGRVSSKLVREVKDLIRRKLRDT